jgi:urease accessory protein
MTSSARILAATVSAAGLAAAATPALAHTGVQAHMHGLGAGLAHPLGGIDHVLAMVAVGLWAGIAGGRAAFAWPAAFVAAMAGAAVLGMAGFPLPGVEAGIALSVVALGSLVALGARAPLALGAAACALFAVAHGWAHGEEMPADAAGVAYAVGFVAATAALHALGLGLAVVGRTVVSPLAARVAGGGVALAGLALLAG